jgi:predicted permease
VILIQAAMPAAVIPVIIAKHYGGDPGAAMRIVLVTSIAGLVTIPFWIQMGMRWIDVQ